MKDVKHWSKYFYPPPQIDGVNVGDDFDQKRDPPLGIYWPVTATILAVHYCNSGTNRSLIELQGAYGNSMITRTEVFVDEKGVVTESVPIFSELSAGYQFECEIEIDKGFGIAQRQLIRPNVPVCNLFGGINNYGFMTPEGTTNSGGGRFRNGDRVVVQFIGGDISKPIITGYYPHPLNTEDGPRFYPGAPETGFTGRVEGTRINVNKLGVFIDTSEAGMQRLVDPKTGEITDVNPNRKIVEADDDTQQPLGAFQLTTKSNILVDASYEDEDVNVGDILLQSKTQGTFKSEIENINIYTDSNEKDVILQEKHGSLRDAARKNDKIKITSGDPNDLFAWCAHVGNVLNQAGKLMATGDEFNIAAAGGLLEELGNSGYPSYAEGRIIEGSPYVQIAGIPTGPDNTDADLEEDCQKEVAASFASNLSDGACSFDIMAYMAKIDALVLIIDVLEQPPLEVPPTPILPYQVLPPGSAAVVEGLKIPIAKWLATCPEIPPFWPPEFAEIIDPILDIDVSDLLALPAILVGTLLTKLKDLINPSKIAAMFPTSKGEEAALDADIKAGVEAEDMTDVNTKTNGAYDAAIITCLDEKTKDE